MIIAIDLQLFMKKKSSQSTCYSNLIQNIYRTPTTTIMLNSKKLNVFSQSVKKQLVLNIVL